jgi:hypothetical protein
MLIRYAALKEEKPSLRHPPAARLASPQAHIACTQLSEHCAAKPPGFVLSHLSGNVALGRERNHCCAGTLVIAPSPVQPTLKKHTEFIKIAAPTALCKSTITP